MMDKAEEEIHDAWMADEKGIIDLCRFCVDDANHPVRTTCTSFRWNGKRLQDVYPRIRLVRKVE